MTCRIRAPRPDDLRALYDLAKLTGGGFTNLPAEKDTLEAKLARSDAGGVRHAAEQRRRTEADADGGDARALDEQPA